MSTPMMLPAFNGGELSPSLWGRTDLAKYRAGCSTVRNMFVSYRGGVVSRAGTKFVGQSKQAGTGLPPVLIPFQFSISQGYVLEFGNQYIRFIENGGYITETAFAVSSATNANPGVFNAAGSSFVVGDWVYLTGLGGMTEVNGNIYVVYSKPTSTSVVLASTLTGAVIDTTNFGVYTSGGTVARIYTISSPYAVIDVPWIKYTQSADTMTLCCVNQDTGTEYPSYELTRITNTNWSLAVDTFAADIGAPATIDVVAQLSSTASTFYSYVVTAVDRATGEESVASLIGSVENNNINVYAGSNTISWSAVPGAQSYNVYKATPSTGVDVPVSSLFGFIGTALGTSLTDTNIVPDFTTTPPLHFDPFARGEATDVVINTTGSNYSQETVGWTVSGSLTGFFGYPIVTGGGISGFFIESQGQGGTSSDTITFTDSGGGLATGSFTGASNPGDGAIIIINGVSLKFRRSSTAPGYNEFPLGNTLALTLQSLSNFCNASNDISLDCATYNSDATHLYISYKTPGTAGNAFTLDGDTSGLTRSAATLTGGGTTGSGASASLVIGAQTGTYPSVPTYFQQRRGYASTLNQPDTYWFSKSGLFSNMDYTIPTVDSDSITGTPWAQQVNGIQFMVPMPGGLVILTGKGAWQLSGGGQAIALTPSNQIAVPQAYNGCSALIPPVTITNDIIYVQSKGSIVRDLSYNFFTNIYTGTDLTVLSNHLFDNNTVQRWDWAEEPNKLLWLVRNDGVLLCMTYLKEQDVWAWTRHDTQGLFQSVAVVSEPPVNAPYFMVKRRIDNNGSPIWAYYIERMDDRLWTSIEDAWCLDSAISYTQNEPSATLTVSGANGEANIGAYNIISRGSGYVSPVGTITDTYLDGGGPGTGAAVTLTVVGGVITSAVPSAQGAGYLRPRLTITDSAGSGAVIQPIVTNYVECVASTGVFSSGNIGDIIRIGGGKLEVETYINATTVVGNVLSPITEVIPDTDPDVDSIPVPAVAGDWTIATPVTTVHGLDYLEGMTVKALADGGVVRNLVVSGGAITLPQPASSIVVGLPFAVQMQTLYLEVPGDVTSQGRRSNVYNVVLRLLASRMPSAGANQPDMSSQPNNQVVPWTNMSLCRPRSPTAHAGQPQQLFTGDVFTNVSASWNDNAQVAVEQLDPVPLTVLAMIPSVDVGDTPG